MVQHVKKLASVTSTMQEQEVQMRDPISPSQRDERNRSASPRGSAKQSISPSAPDRKESFEDGGKYYQFRHRHKSLRVAPVVDEITYRRNIYPCDLFHICTLTLCQFMIGAVNIIVIQYTILSKDWHCFLCGQAWHFYTVEAILLLAFTNYWGTTSRLFLRRVRFMHLILQLISLGHLVTGIMLVLVTKEWILYKAHGIIGLATSVMTLITIMTGPLAILSRSYQNIKFFHVFVGLPTFVLTSLLMILGLYTERFTKAMSHIVSHITSLFVLLYTIYIIALVSHGSSRDIKESKAHYQQQRPPAPFHPVVIFTKNRNW